MGWTIIFIFIGLPILLFPFGLFMTRLLINYKFKSSFINIGLVLGAFLGNPFIILIAYIIISYFVDYSITIQYIFFFLLILILSTIKYLIITRKKIFYKHRYKELLIFSKQYSIQLLYLLYYFYHCIFDGFRAHDFEEGLMFYYFELPSMIISGLVITIYIYYKKKKKINI